MDQTIALRPEARPSFSDLYQRLFKMDVRAVVSPAIAPPETIDTPSRRQRRTSAYSSESAEAAHRGSLSIMRSLFPRHVGDALIRGEKVLPERKEAITMYFADVVGFTNISSTMPAEKVSDMLDRLYLRLDELADILGVYKIETIGDAYLCATNILGDQADGHAAVMARFALEALRAAAATPIDPDDTGKGCVQIRIGLNSGPCMASVVGRKNPKYTLFGDTINIASRMESMAHPGRIQCTARTAELIRSQDPGAVHLQRRGLISVKGKQGLMETYWILDLAQEPFDHSQPNSPARFLRPEASATAASATPHASSLVLMDCGVESAEPVQPHSSPPAPYVSAGEVSPGPLVLPDSGPLFHIRPGTVFEAPTETRANPTAPRAAAGGGLCLYQLLPRWEPVTTHLTRRRLSEEEVPVTVRVKPRPRRHSSAAPGKLTVGVSDKAKSAVTAAPTELVTVLLAAPVMEL
jgi:class 3 adenylate cyclase